MEGIFENMPELPPEDVAEGVSPCRKALNRILTGFALNAITLNFFCLNYILPAIGTLLILLGTRTLRRENSWLKGCFVLSCLRATVLTAALIADTTVTFRSLETAFTVINTVLVFLLFISFGKGLGQLQKKAGTGTDAKAATALTVWYVILLLLALIHYQGYIISIGMLVCYGFIIRSLFRISKALDEAGYAVETAPVRISDGWLTVLAALVLTVGAFLGYTFGSNYPMDWIPDDAAESSEIQEIKERLSELGFPSDVLEDLSEEDILACGGAVAVVSDVKDFPVNDGREVREYRDGGFYTTTVYDNKELRLTGIAVKLPTEREQWKVIHHFRWILPHNKKGTECIQLWPAYRQGTGWYESGEVSGRVLCDVDGVACASEYRYLGMKTYTSDSILFGSRSSRDIFAEFSMNKKGENHRGYISYTTAENIDGYIFDSWINYTHQKRLLQFPARSAMEHRMTNGFGNGGAFITVQDALQMYNGKLLT